MKVGQALGLRGPLRPALPVRKEQLMRSIILTLALAAIAAAQQPRLKDAQEGWVSLFNGKDLAGWVKVGGEQWTVEDGAIHGVGVTKGYGYLMTEKHYKDFELAIRFQCVTGGNSGIFYRTSFKPGTARRCRGIPVRDRPQYQPSHRRHLYRAARLDRLAVARERVRDQAHGVERLRPHRGGQPPSRAPERRAGDRLHRPGERGGRRRDCAAVACRRGGQYAVQRHLHPRSLSAVERDARPVRPRRHKMRPRALMAELTSPERQPESAD